MSLRSRIDQDFIASMKAREAGRARLSVLRLVRAAAKNREIELGRPLEDDDLVEVIAKELKQRRESREEFAKAGREELVQKADEEAAILNAYLPEPLDGEALDALIRETAAAVGATSPKEMGKVMGRLMPKVRGRADGNEVRRRVEAHLKGTDAPPPPS